MADILRGMGSRYVVVGGVADHVHLLYDLGRTNKISDCVEELKRESSKFVKGFGANKEKFYWQRGYGAFSVSPTERNSVVSYIHQQEEHHRIRTFQEEYREILNRYEIEFDERYVWE
jgi:REP element-mobilizing transposase RayT